MIDLLAACASEASDRFDLWCRIIRALDVRRMAEVGVWRGEFARRILEECPAVDAYHMIDPWRPLDGWNKPANVSAKMFSRIHRQALVATEFAGSRAHVLRGTTLEVASQLSDGALDCVYVDGDHTLRGITIDLFTMIAKVRAGGLLGGDDYHADPWHHGRAYEPSLVCPFAVFFAEAMRLPFVALPCRQFVIVNEPIGYSFTNLSGADCRDRVGRPVALPVRAWQRAQTITRRVFRLFA